MDKFRCACCNGNFEVLDPKEQEVLDDVPLDFVPVCDACYEEIMEYEASPK